LDSLESLLKGGRSGPAVVPGDPAASLLLKALRYDELQMPPDGKLPDKVIADFATWIKQGAVDPREKAVAQPRRGGDLPGKKHWAFNSPQLHDAPSVNHPIWPTRKIDRFLLARLEQAGIEPNPPTDRRTWIRRVSFDLIGLPPTPEEIESFVNDPATDAHEKLVERLLASPRYGERWARLWLDIARYAEDQAHIVGNDQALFYPNAYLYRDWIIQAFNADMPYDRFLRSQLAADLIEPNDTTNHAAGNTPFYRRAGGGKLASASSVRQ
jgi:hypothetical protein